MADTKEFFSDYLPQKLKDNPDLCTMGAVYQFNIGGAGTWTLNLNGADTAGVIEGASDDATCIITTDKGTWEGILDNPAKAMRAFMGGSLKATNLGQATKLQQILG